MKKSHQHEHDSWSMVENRANGSTGLNGPERAKAPGTLCSVADKGQTAAA